MPVCSQMWAGKYKYEITQWKNRNKIYVKIPWKCHTHEAQPSCGSEVQKMTKHNYETTDAMTKKYYNRGTALERSVEKTTGGGGGGGRSSIWFTGSMI